MNDDLNDTKENKPLKTHEQQELVNQAEQVLANFHKLDREIKFSARDFQNKFDAINAQIKKWSEGLAGFNATLDEKLLLLAKETTILTALPDKLEYRLKQIIPAIATEIQKQTFQNFDTAMSNASKAVDQLNSKIQENNRVLLEMNQNAFKKKLINLALLLSITIFASTGLTYAIMQRFPSKVTIDTKGEVNINGGDVSVWEWGGKKAKKK